MTTPESASLRVACPQCGSKILLAANQLGTLVTCDQCLEEFTAERAEDLPLETSAELDALLSTDFDAVPADAVPADDGALPLDSDLAVDEYPDRKRTTLESDYAFTMACRLCGTRVDATDDQIGQRVRCPDCHSWIEIRTPPARARRPRHGADRLEDDTFGLGVSDEPPVGAARPSDATPMIYTDVSGEMNRVSSIGEDALRDAEADRERAEVIAAAQRNTSVSRGAFSFLLDLSAALRWLVLAAALQLELSFIIAALRGFSAGGLMGHMQTMVLTTLSVCFGASLLVAVSVTALAVLRDSANGHDQVDEWPSLSPIDWVFDASYVFSSGFPVVVVGAFACQAFGVWGGTLVALALGSVVFPLLLLSTLEASSPAGYYSAPIWRSLKTSRVLWIQLIAMTLGLAAFSVVAWQFRRLEFVVTNYLAALAMVVAFAVYFRLIGRLAWFSQEDLLASEEEDEDE
jgi:DNA-directed RNA polymerase subunit RPC12/RpoP